MPCDVGYKNVARVSIPQPQPKRFKEKTKPPQVDADLLEKIGEDDPVFLDWLKGLDIRPLLEEALRLAEAEVKNTAALKAEISDSGWLVMSGLYEDKKTKSELEETAKNLGSRFQIEALAIIAKLLDYEIRVTKHGRGADASLVLEGEKHVGHGVHRYIKISKDKNGDGVMAFEHFASKQELTSERQKFQGLAEKLGVRITVESFEERGQPIAPGTSHKDFLH